MCGKLDHYIEVFTKLRTDKSNKRWAEETTFRAPYKLLLLLSIMDLLATGTVTIFQATAKLLLARSGEFGKAQKKTLRK